MLQNNSILVSLPASLKNLWPYLLLFAIYYSYIINLFCLDFFFLCSSDVVFHIQAVSIGLAFLFCPHVQDQGKAILIIWTPYGRTGNNKLRLILFFWEKSYESLLFESINWTVTTCSKLQSCESWSHSSNWNCWYLSLLHCFSISL